MKQALFRAQNLIKRAKEINPEATDKVIEELNQIVNFDSRMPIMRVMLHINNIASGNVLETKEKEINRCRN